MTPSAVNPNLYCTTLSLPAGRTEYKFIVNNSIVEAFPPDGPGDCYFTPFYPFTNRFVDVVCGVDQNLIFGFNSCGVSCKGPTTFCIEPQCFDGDVNTVSVFGEFNNFDFPGIPLTTDDGCTYCVDIYIAPGCFEYLFVVNGSEVESFAPNADPCTSTAFGFTNREHCVANIPSPANSPAVAGWETCEAPVAMAVCQPVTLMLGSDGTASLDPSMVDGGSTDGCGNTPDLSINQTGFSCLDISDCIGVVEVTLMARSSRCPTGIETNTCVSQVTIVNSVGPSLVCSDLTVSVDGGGQAEIWASSLATATGCITGDAVTLEADRSLIFTCNDLIVGPESCGTVIPVTITGFDSCGNGATCISNVTLQDNIAPTIFCPSDKTLSLAPGLCGEFNTQPLPQFEDNCGGIIAQMAAPTGVINVECRVDTLGNAICDGPAESEPILYSFMATDNCGNTSTCEYTVTLREFESSSNSLSCNDKVYTSADVDCDFEIKAELLLQGDQGCFTCYDVTVEEFHIEGALREYEVMVTDPCTGVSCWGTVIVEDKIDPTLACQDCTDPLVPDPACHLNCTELELFTLLDRDTGVRGYDESLLDQLIPTDPVDFIRDFYDDGCAGQSPAPINPPRASFVDNVTSTQCGSSILQRTWTVEFSRPDGSVGTLNCDRYYSFDQIKPKTMVNADGELEGVEGTCSVEEDVILMPRAVVIIPTCSVGTSPAEIQAFFDNPLSEDDDTDDDGIDPDELDIDCVVENNEGTCWAYPHYYITGTALPRGSKHAQAVIDQVCDILVTYEDTSLESCAAECMGNQKLRRTWTVLDWCTNEFFDYDQVIKVMDEIAPRLEVGPITASVDPWDCKADVLLPHPEHLSDACDNELTYHIEYIDGALSVSGNATDGYVVHGAPLGLTQIQYVAEDCCGNRTKVLADLTVVDNTPPVPVTIQNIVVEFTGFGTPNQGVDGTAKLHVEDVDNGSYDSCTDVIVELRRSGTCDPRDTIWGEFVTFCCEDLGGSESVLIDVEMRVRDWNDNETIIWSTIRLEDKAGGSGTCPPDIVIECTQDIWDFNVTGGLPRSFTTCEEIPVETDTLQVREDTNPRRKPATQGGQSLGLYFGRLVEAYDPSCGFGAYFREYTNGCEQWIILEPISGVTIDNRGTVTTADDLYVYTSSFDPTTIRFPEDIEVDCDGYETGEPTWLEAHCNLVGYTLKSDTIDFESDACVKIINHWTVIDWCAYDPTDPDLNNINDVPGPGDRFDRYVHDTGEVEGRYIHTQVIKVIDTEAPVITGEDDLCFAATENCGSKGLSVSAIGVDNGECSSAWIAWEVDVDLFDDWAIDCSFSSYVSPVLPSGEPNPKYLEKSSNGETVTIGIPDGTRGSKARHRVEWTAHDGCGNSGTWTSYFTIEDKKAPTPYCLNLGTAVMSNGEVELWAVDFDNGSFDNCYDQETLLFTFTDVPPPPRCDAEYDSAADLQWYDGTFWFYDSSEIEDDEQECGVTGAGEYQDLGDYGGEVHRWEPGLRSSGKIFTTADVDANGFLVIPIYVWDGCQNIDFCNVQLRVIDNGGGALVAGVVRTENSHTISGVTTQLESDDPNQTMKTMVTQADGQFRFAGNVKSRDYEVSGSKDGDDGNGVSTVDLVQIQRHILGIERFTSPYQMIAADINDDQRVNGQDLVELRKLILGIYTEFPQNESWKILDATSVMTMNDPWTYSTTRTIRDMSEDRMDEDFIGVKIGDVDGDVIVNAAQAPTVGRVINLTTGQQTVDAGEEVTITMNTTESLYGYQMTLDLRGMEVISVRGIADDRLGLFENSVTISENVTEAVTGELFTLTLRAETAGEVTEKISITDGITRAEAYVGENLEVVGLRLNGEEDEEFSLGQNEPNPFRTETTISYSLSRSQAVKLTFMDMTGKIMKTLKLEGQAGENSVKVDNTGLTGGIIYYQLEAGEQTATRHMIVIE